MSDPRDSDRQRWLQRVLEMVPGVISWAAIIGPIWLSVSYPWLVAYFVLSFDFYWLCRSVWFGAAVIVAFRRIGRVLAVDWGGRLEALDDPDRHREALRARLGTHERPAGALGVAAAGQGPSRGSRRRLADELRAFDAVAAMEEPPPEWREYTHLALIPTYTEPLEKLRETVRALARAEWPRERKICAIITRETDLPGRENVALLREEFGEEFARFIHILDPLEPTLPVGVTRLGHVPSSGS